MANDEEEPTMDDFLASIRRILSEDDIEPPMAHDTKPSPPRDEDVVAARWIAADGEEALMAEWEAVVGGAFEPADDVRPAVPPERPCTRVLNQDEIDSLLGGDEDEPPVSGLQALLDATFTEYERLPMLELVFDRMIRRLTTVLGDQLGDVVEVSLDNILSMRMGDYLNSVPLPAMLSVFQAREWGGQGLLVCDSSLIFSSIDLLAGGRRGTAAMRIQGRPYTAIERRLMQMVKGVVLDCLEAAFAPITPVTMAFQRLETNPRFVGISRPSNAIVVAKLRVDAGDRGGRMDLVLPYATLEPVRELMSQMFLGEKFGHDPLWEAHLSEELRKTKVRLDAVLGEAEMPLRDVLAWRVGSSVEMKTSLKMMCGDTVVADGERSENGIMINNMFPKDD